MTVQGACAEIAFRATGAAASFGAADCDACGRLCVVLRTGFALLVDALLVDVGAIVLLVSVLLVPAVSRFVALRFLVATTGRALSIAVAVGRRLLLFLVAVYVGGDVLGHVVRFLFGRIVRL
jgi:hypothetical protein